MKLIKNDGFRELFFLRDGLNEQFLDESLIKSLQENTEPVVINLKALPFISSEDMIGLLRWLSDIELISDAFIVIFASSFACRVIKAVLGDEYPVFTLRSELEVSIRQDVAANEKELLWGQ